MTNPNTKTATIFVDALHHAGLDAVCIAPGSRSTPLTLAFAAHPQIRVYSHIDERCASFFALGLALATDRPVAIVCTSGTAAANFLPAIIEAHMSQVPLLVLTADRPHELRHSGANQTIDQVKMYGDQVLWAVDMALPQANAPEVAWQNVAATAARAYAVANGMRKGAVHINFPFRKPLQPASPNESIATRITKPAPAIERGTITPVREQIDSLAQLIKKHERGLIVCGPSCPSGKDLRKVPKDRNSSEMDDGDLPEVGSYAPDFAEAVHKLSQQTGYPIVADPLSGLRFVGQVREKDDEYEKENELGNLICSYETFLAGGTNANGELFDHPDIVIRFGAVPTSKWINDYLAAAPIPHRIHVRESGVWADDSHLTTHFVQANEVAMCDAISQKITPRPANKWAKSIISVEQKTRSGLMDGLEESSFDAAYMVDLLHALPDGARLFMGNSLPIRHLDQFGMPTRNGLHVYGNRGASGIDGTVSGALGVAAAGADPLVLAIGDVTFAHDLNGLLHFALNENRMGAGKQINAPVTIVLFNNGGGNIFRRLPIASFEPPFESLFLTPHQLDFAALVLGYGWRFARAESRTDFLQKLDASINSATPSVIEVVTDGAEDERVRQELLEGMRG